MDIYQSTGTLYPWPACFLRQPSTQTAPTQRPGWRVVATRVLNTGILAAGMLGDPSDPDPVETDFRDQHLFLAGLRDRLSATTSVSR